MIPVRLRRLRRLRRCLLPWLRRGLGAAPPDRRTSLRWRANLILAAVALSVLTGLTGHFALHRIGDFHRGNFVHLQSAAEARRLVEYARSPEDMRAVLGYVEAATQQARGCLETVTPLERALLGLIGSGGAPGLCEAALRAGARAADLVAGHEEGWIGQRTLADSLATIAEDMMAYSSAFAPHVERAERFALRAVALATALLGAALTALVWRATRTTLALWDAAQRERHRLETAIGAIDEGFAIYDAGDRLITFNAAYPRLATATPEAVRPGMSRAAVMRLGLRDGTYGPVAAAAVEARVAAHAARLDAGRPNELVTGDDRHIRVHQTVSETGDRVVVRSDRTEHRRLEQEQKRHAEMLHAAKRAVERQALEDPLTGLANRRAFGEALATRMRRLQAAQAAGAAALPGADEAVLVRVDLDAFKYVNDVFGHATGDAVLRHVAGLLEGESGPGDLAARIGGDEFVLLLAAGATVAAAEARVARLRARLQAPFEQEGRPCRLSASFGIASSAAGAADADELLSFADVALYEAKARGRDRAELFTPAIHARLLHHRRLADELREGLERGELEPFFQPQMDARTLEITGAEVLVRWRRPDGTLRGPDDFLEIARQLRLTGEIDAMMFDKASRVSARWRAEGICPPKLSFNVSSQRMHDPGLVEAARSLAARGPRIAFELLESTMIEEESAVFAFHLDALKEAGIGIEIDDFGSGRASVLGVIRAGPDTLKIDQRLIRPLPRQESLQRMVRAIVEIGRALDVAITAEGVETMAHARMLAGFGCRTLQGYAFAPPLSAADYAAFARGYAARGPARRGEAG